MGILIAAVSAAVCVGASGQDGQSSPGLLFVPQQPAQIRLEGTSSLQKWDVSGTAIDGIMSAAVSVGALEALLASGLGEYHASGLFPASAGDLNLQVRLEIPAATLTCRNLQMRRKLLDSIRAEQHPLIRYDFVGLDSPPVVALPAGGRIAEVLVRGNLTLAGQTRMVAHTVRVQFSSADRIEFSGLLALNMKDFGIDPPVALLGLVRAHADFDVHYRFHAERREAVQAN